MKAKLTSWISEAVQEMNASKREKVQHCYVKIGLSDAWDALKRHELYEEAVEKKGPCFLTCKTTAVLSMKLTTFSLQFNLVFEWLQMLMTGDVTSVAQEEDKDIEKQLVDHVVQVATSLGIENAETGDIQSDEAAQDSGEINLLYIMILIDI